MALDNKFKILTGLLLGIVVGLIIAFLGDLKFKWLIVFSLMVMFPLFIAYTGSARYALTAALIFSLSTQMSFNPFFSQYYSTIEFGWRISLTGLILLAAYAVWFFEILQRKNTVRYFWSTTLPLFLFIAWGAWGYDTAKKPSYIPFLIMQSIEGLLVYFYAANFIKSPKDMLFVIRWVTITVVITSVVAIIQYLKSDFLNLRFMGWSDEPLKLYYGGKVIARPCGFLGHANNLAAFLICWLSLLFILIVGSPSSLKKSFPRLLAFTLGLAALVLTFSRGGWLAFVLAVSIIPTFFFKGHLRRQLPRTLPRILGLGMLAVVIAVPFTPYIYQRLTQDDYSAGGSRIMLAQRALDVIAENPLHGLGFGYYLDFNPVPPHNMYLQMAAELGIPGLIFFLWASWGFFSQGMSALKSEEGSVLLLTIGLLAGLSAGYLHGMVELGTIAYQKFLSYLFIGGLLVSLAQYHRQTIQSQRASASLRPIPEPKKLTKV